jgi:hypothetical protein
MLPAVWRSLRRFNQERLASVEATMESASTVESAAMCHEPAASRATVINRRSMESRTTSYESTARADEAAANIAMAIESGIKRMSPTVIPRAGANEHATRKPARAIISVRSARVRIVVIVAVGANRRSGDPDSNRTNSNSYSHLRLRIRKRQNHHHTQHRQISKSFHSEPPSSPIRFELRCRFHFSHRLACHRCHRFDHSLFDHPKPEAFGFFFLELPTHLNAAGAEKLLIPEWLISATLVDFNYLQAMRGGNS